jgi:uncharacterized protein (TIGR02246 family)
MSESLPGGLTMTRLALLAATSLLAIGCAQQPPAPLETPDTRVADEAAIRSAVSDWAAAAQAKDAEKFVSFYAEDATVMMEDAPDVTGIAGIREAIGGMMQDPNFALSFTPTGVEVARSGDLALESGSYSMTMTDPASKQAATEKGNYLVVWKKQADGTWKVSRDIPVSDGAAAPVAQP